MRRLPFLDGFALLALVPALVSAGPGPDQDPEPLDYWLARLKDADPEHRVEAAQELHKRTLPEAVARRDPTRPDARPLRPREIAALVPALVGALRDPNPVVRRTLVGALADVGPKAGAAVPALCELLEDEQDDVRSRTAWALGEIGPDPERSVLPALAKALGDRAPAVRREAAYTLGKVGPEAATTEAALRKAAEDPEVRVRVAARLALWRINGEDKQVRLGLADAAGAKGAAELDAFTWLSAVGPPAVPVLLGELRHREARVRSLAAYAIAEVRPPAEEAVSDLIVALSDRDPTVRGIAAYGLGQVGPAARDAVPALRKALKDGDATVRGNAADALKAVERDGARKPVIQ